MSSENLKARAKRLRPAIAAMFSVPVSHSQSLELVAHEENFPTWDAASACAGKAQVKPKTPGALQQTNIKIQWGAPPTLSTIFAEHQDHQTELVQMLTEPGAGSLVLVASLVANGKTTTANALFEAALANSGQGATGVAHVETLEHRYPSNVKVFEFSEPLSICTSEVIAEDLILVDEIRTPRLAFEVVALVQAGKKVVATIAASPVKVHQRLRALLSAFGVNSSMLDGLIEKGQVRAVYQEILWNDKPRPVIVVPDSHRVLLQRAGVSN